MASSYQSTSGLVQPTLGRIDVKHSGTSRESTSPCVEACPCDAIRMDTKVHAPLTLRRADAILDKEALLERGEVSTATQGGVGAFWREKVKA
jgi:hypothetical protein